MCAATPDDLAAALAHLQRQPRVVTLNPHSLSDVCADIRAVGEATGHNTQANALIAGFDSEIAKVEQSVFGFARPRVLCLEWLDPPYVAGHWVPEMVERAGGMDVLGLPGKASFRVSWEEVLAAKPEVIVIMPCGLQPRRRSSRVSQPAGATGVARIACCANGPSVRGRGFGLFFAARAASCGGVGSFGEDPSSRESS